MFVARWNGSKIFPAIAGSIRRCRESVGDADLLVWWKGTDPDALQGAYSGLRRTAVGAHLEPVWSSVGLHRPAEFNKSHIPAFLAGEPALAYVCVYPFVRTPEWYLLPADERAAPADGGVGEGEPDAEAERIGEEHHQEPDRGRQAHHDQEQLVVQQPGEPARLVLRIGARGR